MDCPWVLHLPHGTLGPGASLTARGGYVPALVDLGLDQPLLHLYQTDLLQPHPAEAALQLVHRPASLSTFTYTDAYIYVM